MEMHQIRYFLTVCETLNFTHAAEECHVAQPSLTRAIKKLEAELGGELFLRERSRTHVSDLGRTKLPVAFRPRPGQHATARGVFAQPRPTPEVGIRGLSHCCIAGDGSLWLNLLHSLEALKAGGMQSNGGGPIGPDLPEPQK